MIEQPRNYPLTSFTQENDSTIIVVTPKDTLRFIHDPEEHHFNCHPKVVFIPDIDMFPQSQLLMLIPIIRLLQWFSEEKLDPRADFILSYCSGDLQYHVSRLIADFMEAWVK